MVGAVVPLPLVWDFADAANALMAIPIGNGEFFADF
jgi:Na+/alanine symporter